MEKIEGTLRRAGLLVIGNFRRGKARRPQKTNHLFLKTCPKYADRVRCPLCNRLPLLPLFAFILSLHYMLQEQSTRTLSCFQVYFRNWWHMFWHTRKILIANEPLKMKEVLEMDESSEREVIKGKQITTIH